MSSFEIIGEFALEHLHAESPTKRAKVYRALASLSHSPDEKRQFDSLADNCDAITARHEQLAFDFKRARAGRGRKGGAA